MARVSSRGLLSAWTSVMVVLVCIAALETAIQSRSVQSEPPGPQPSETRGTASPMAAPSPVSRDPSPTADGVPSASRAGPDVASAISTIDLLNGTSETGIYTPPFQGDPFDVTPDDLDHKLFLPEPGTGGTISSGDNTLAVVDLVSGNVSSEIYGGPNPEFTFLDPQYDRLYVGDASSAALRVYDASTTQFIQSINLTGPPGQMVRDPGNGALYVTEGGSSGLAKLDPATESVIASAHLGSGPMWAAFDPVTNDILVGDAYDDDLWSVNATTLAVDGLNSNFGPMSGIAADPLSGWFFVGINYGAGLGWVEALNGSVNGSKQKFSPPYLETGGLAYDPVNENIYFADVAHSAMYPINASTLTLGSLIRVGGGPDAIAYDVASGHLLVADTYGFAVTEVDPATATTVRTIHTNAFPTGIVYDEVNSRLAVLGYPPGEALVRTSGTVGWRTVACASSFSYLIGVPDRGEQLAAGGSELCVLNATSQAPIVQFSSPNSETVTALSFDPSAGEVLVGTQSSGSPAHGFLYFLNTSDWAVERTVALGANATPSGVLVAPSNGLVFVSECARGIVGVYNWSANRILVNSTTGGCPGALAFDPTTNVVFVYDVGTDLAALSGTTGAAVSRPTLTVSGPGDLVFDPYDGILYVADSGLSGLSAFDPSSYTSTAIAVGAGPLGIALDPTDNLLYVLDSGDTLGYNGGTLTVLSSCGTSCLSLDAVTASPPVLPLGSVVGISTSASGGSPPYTSTLLDGPPGCGNTFVSSERCTPSEAGSYELVARVTDNSQRSAVRETLLVVTGNLSVGTFGALPNTTDVGRPLEFEATPLHGVPPFQWTYSGLPAGCGSVSLENFSCTPTETGPFTASVTVTDSTREKAASNTSLFVNPAPSVNASITPGSVTLHGAFVIEFEITGGTGPFTAGVGPDPAAACTATNSTRFDCTAESTGSVNLNVSILDAAGAHANTSVALTVLPASNAPLGAVGFLPPWALWAVVGAVAAAVAATALLLHRRSDRKRTPAPAEPVLSPGRI